MSYRQLNMFSFDPQTQLHVIWHTFAHCQTGRIKFVEILIFHICHAFSVCSCLWLNQIPEGCDATTKIAQPWIFLTKSHEWMVKCVNSLKKLLWAWKIFTGVSIRPQLFFTLGPFHQYGLTLFQGWGVYHMPSKVWDKISYPFPNSNGCTIEICDTISTFTPHFTMDVITYPCWNWS